MRIELHDGHANSGRGSARGLNRVFECGRIGCKAKIAHESGPWRSAIRFVARQPRKCSAGANDRFEQAPGGYAVTEIEAIAEDSIHPEKNCEWSHDVVEALADEHDSAAGL